MIKLNILKMNDFLEVVNQCAGPINVLAPDGTRANLSKDYKAQADLRRRHKENGDSTWLTLVIPQFKDYLKVVLFSIGDS